MDYWKGTSQLERHCSICFSTWKVLFLSIEIFQLRLCKWDISIEISQLRTFNWELPINWKEAKCKLKALNHIERYQFTKLDLSKHKLRVFNWHHSNWDLPICNLKPIKLKALNWKFSIETLPWKELKRYQLRTVPIEYISIEMTQTHPFGFLTN